MKFSATLSLALSSLALFEFASADVDPCTVVSQWPNRVKTYGGWEESKACLESFPFNHTIAHQTLDTVIDALNSFFVFKDVAAHPPHSRLSIKNVDIIAELKALRYKKYTTDFAFQTDIQNIVLSLYDAHLNYVPNCYSWEWIQALFLYAAVENGKQSIKVFNVAKDVFPSVTTDLIDCEVVEIDDEPAFKVIVDFARENVGDYKDLSVRFNAALMTNHKYFNGSFQNYDGSWQDRQQLPDKPLTKYKLQCPNEVTHTITLPWIVRARNGDYHDSQSYYDKECAVQGPASMSSKVRRFYDVPSIHTEGDHSQLGGAAPEHVSHQSNDTFGYTYITSDDMYLFGYFSKGNGVYHKTGIINIGTFVPSDFDKSIQTLRDGLIEFKKLGIEKIILDVQYNGGGSICLAETLLHVLFNQIGGDYKSPDLEYATDILATEQLVMLGMLEVDNVNCSWSAVGLDGAADGKQLNDSSWLTNPIEYTRGGKTSHYSQRVRSNCAQDLMDRDNNYLKDLGQLPWKPEDYIILSNGQCGSSCALLSNRLHLLKHVKTVAVGGILGHPMTYQSFPGFEVLDYDTQILPYTNSDQYGNFNQKYPILFKNIIPLPQQVSFRFTFRQAYYPDGSNTPLEYQFIPADERIYYDAESIRNIYSLWYKVAKYFG